MAACRRQNRLDNELCHLRDLKGRDLPPVKERALKVPDEFDGGTSLRVSRKVLWKMAIRSATGR